MTDRIATPWGESASQFDYALFIFGGLIAYSFFSEMAFRGPSLLHEYAHFIKQTMFPAEMLPIISTLRATVYVLIGLVVMLAAQIVLTGTVHWTLILLPLWLLPFLAFLIGMTWFLAALGAFTRLAQPKDSFPCGAAAFAALRDLARGRGRHGVADLQRPFARLDQP